MNGQFEDEFNEFIVETFHLILKEEMKFIQTLSNSELSSREIHLLQTVGQNDGKTTITDISESLKITLASVTIMVNKLESQNYLTKQKAASDGRSVQLSLTESGKQIDKCHYEFHNILVDRISSKMTDFEKEVLLSGVKKLNEFFKNDLGSGHK